MRRLTNNEFAEVCLNEAAILNEVSDNVIAAGLGIPAMAAVIGILIWDHKDRKKQKIKDEEKRAEEAKQRDEEDKKVFNTYAVKVGNEITNIKISSRDDLIKRLITDINKCCALCKSDPKLSQKIKQSIDDLKKDGFDEKIQYKLGGCKFDDWDGDYLVVIDGDQMIRIYLSWILHDIKIVLNRKWGKLLKEYDIKIGTGDGDEGCIYFD